MLLLFKNSLILAVSITFLNTFLSALAAYAIAKIPFPGRKQIFGFMLATMMIPGVLFLIPTYVMMYRLGWVGHFYALIIPSAISVYNIFLIRQFVVGIPNEQIEAARLDGANDLHIFTNIILPALPSRPGDGCDPQLYRQLERLSRSAALPEPPGHLDGPAWPLPVPKLDPWRTRPGDLGLDDLDHPAAGPHLLLAARPVHQGFCQCEFQMTTSLQTPTTIPVQVPGEAAETAAAAARARFGKRILIGLLILAVVFLVTYALAWYNANLLATRFFQDSEASFTAGDYLKALVGYQQFDEKTNKYINYGGYLNVEKIWSSSYSWPQPPYVQQAVKRSQEIIGQKLTVQQAEQYIQENTGRPGTPYFAEIYLRLGELYEQNGDTKDAMDVYQSYRQPVPRPQGSDRTGSAAPGKTAKPD